jgi:hypothetical protein
MGEYQLGNNLYGNDTGQYYSYQHGPYTLNGKQYNGLYKSYQSSPWDSQQNQINSLYGAQQKSQLDSLKSQQQTALSGLAQQQKVSDQGFYGQRNQADVTNAQNVQRMREAMAANGINASGENVTATAGLAAQRQGAFNDINNKQADANAQFNLQRADINNPQHAQDIINAINQQKSQALLSAFHDYLARLDAQHQQYIQQNQFDASQAAQQRQFDASQAMQKYGLDTNAKYAAGQAGFDNGSGGGGTSTGAAGKAAFLANLAEANKRGLDPSQNAALTWLVEHESTFNPGAHNPHSSAYGYGQFIKANQDYYSKKMHLNYNDPVDQLLMMEQYVQDRYGGANNAMKYWQSHGNY